MSILIKEMEMPKSCAECFVAWERCHRTVEWYKNNPQYYDIRHEDCPLIELPDIYIDIAKAFMTELTDKVCIKGGEDG